MNISTKQFLRALSENDILRDGDLEMLRVHHDCRECRATASQLCKLLGKSDKIVVNGQFGRLGKRIAKFLELKPPARGDGTYWFWNVLAHGQEGGTYFFWQLRSELIEALHQLGHLEESQSAIPGEIQDTVDLFEGSKRQIWVNAYERNSTARRICIQKYGSACQACGFNFECAYGEIGEGFVHVHHLRELSEIGAEYKVNPEEDLRPVCPNCHAMLHRRKPAFKIEELQKRLRKLPNPLTLPHDERD